MYYIKSYIMILHTILACRIDVYIVKV